MEELITQWQALPTIEQVKIITSLIETAAVGFAVGYLIAHFLSNRW